MLRLQRLAHFIKKIRIQIRSNTPLNLLIKSGAAILLLLLLYFDLTSNDKLGDIWIAFQHQLKTADLPLLVVVLLLMPLNWMAEAEKWRQFVHRYEHFPRRKALLAVMTGVSFSLFTPNRVGEYGGRMLYVHPRNQWRAIVANLVGNFCQFMVLLGIGAIGSMYIIHRFELVDPTLGNLLIAAAVTGSAAMLWCYYHIDLVIDIIKRLQVVHPFLPWLRQLNLGVIRQYSTSDLTNILRWALIRFVIYSVQYYLLLRFFGINPGIIPGFAGIAALFLLQTSIPLPPVAGLVARGNMAVLLWEQFGANEIAALAATFSLWVINLVIPALIGTFSFFYVNISKSLGYEEDTIQDDIETIPSGRHWVPEPPQ
jgi:hypothetical protein